MHPPPKVGPHYRAPWRVTDPRDVLVHARLDEISGSYQRSEKEGKRFQERYRRAKSSFDMAAAFDIVSENVSAQTIDAIVDRLIVANMPAIVGLPHPEYDAGAADHVAAPTVTNALPFAYARYLADELGCEVDEDIVEVARPSRTKLGLFPRFLWQPMFDGAVRLDRAYILVDDVCTTCGTLAALRSHIVAHGGTVIVVSTLGRSNGRNVGFPIAETTVRDLFRGFGEGLNEFWISEIGHDTRCLTEAEGHSLSQWHTQHCADCGSGPSALQRLGNRLAEAAAKAK